MKISPIGGKLVAPESPVGEFVFADFKNFPILVLPFLLVLLIFHFCNRSVSVFGD